MREIRLGHNPFDYCTCKLICNSNFFRVVDNVLYDADMSSVISFLSGGISYVIPSSVTHIGNSAFSGCGSLREVTIPSSVTYIGDWVFSNCDSLREIVIPSSVIRIGHNPFAHCTCKLICNSVYFRVVDNVLYDANMSRIISFLSDATYFAIPPSVSHIGNHAFVDCDSLREIKIPQGSRAKFEKLLPSDKDKLVEIKDI